MTSADDKIATNIRKGVLEFCVLALLVEREMYGLELANELTERQLTASEGSLYPLLARMRDNGLVADRWHTPATGRARRYYSPTPEGRAHLAAFAAVWSPLSRQVSALLKEEA
ncbi:MAG: PadR family transcriptional regulator [Microcella sp.]